MSRIALEMGGQVGQGGQEEQHLCCQSLSPRFLQPAWRLIPPSQLVRVES